MLVMVDVDSTLYDASKLFAEVAKEHFNLTLPVNSENWHEYHAYTDVPTLVKIFRKAHSESYVSANVPYVGAKSVCDLIQDKGHDLYFVSDRHPQSAGALTRWILEHFDAPRSQVVVGKDKREWLRSNQPDIVIDDRVRTMIMAVFELGARVFSIEQPWNVNLKKEIDNIFICESWDQIGKTIEEFI